MDIKHFLKLEISGWSKAELFTLFFVLLTIFVNSYYTHDSIIAVVSAVCGIFYTFIAGKGKISCYLFGLTGSGFYCYLAWHNGLYGNLLLYALYYIPMQLMGILKWRKYLKKSTNEIIKTRLMFKNRLLICLTSIILCFLVIQILHYFNDSNPVIDGITTALSIIGMYLTVKRCIEQWLIWAIVNFLSVLMWINVVLHGQKAYSTVIMWSVYFILAIYFYIKWRRELDVIES